MSETDRPKKMGLTSWALAGGIYFGGVPGSKAGGIGTALLGAGAFKVWRAMEGAHDQNIRSRLLPLFLLFGLLGVGVLVFGYYQYAASQDAAPAAVSDGDHQGSVESSSQDLPGGA